VAQAGRGHGLPAKALAEGLLTAQVGVRKLYRHGARQEDIVALPYLRHPAPGDEFDQAVAVRQDAVGALSVSALVHRAKLPAQRRGQDISPCFVASKG
jgi:hypothetical protein